MRRRIAVGRQLAQRVADLLGRVPQAGERLAHVADHTATRATTDRFEDRQVEAVAQFDEQPLGRLLADARHERQRGQVVGGDHVDERRR